MLLTCMLRCQLLCWFCSVQWHKQAAGGLIHPVQFNQTPQPDAFEITSADRSLGTLTPCPAALRAPTHSISTGLRRRGGWCQWRPRRNRIHVPVPLSHHLVLTLLHGLLLLQVHLHPPIVKLHRRARSQCSSTQMRSARSCSIGHAQTSVSIIRLRAPAGRSHRIAWK